MWTVPASLDKAVTKESPGVLEQGLLPATNQYALFGKELLTQYRALLEMDPWDPRTSTDPGSQRGIPPSYSVGRARQRSTGSRDRPIQDEAQSGQRLGQQLMEILGLRAPYPTPTTHSGRCPGYHDDEVREEKNGQT